MKEERIETILINPNIATVQTSKGMADKVYVERKEEEEEKRRREREEEQREKKNLNVVRMTSSS